MEKKKLLYWFWALVCSSTIASADEFSAFKQEIFDKAKLEAKQFASDVSTLKKNTKPVDRKIIDDVMGKAKEESLKFRDTIEQTKIKAKKEAVKWQKEATQAKANAKKFAKNWKINKDDKISETFTGYADLPTIKGILNQKPAMYIFISFGVSENLVLDLAVQANKIGAKLVVRGLKNNSFKDTINYIHQLNKQGIKVDINPKLFDKYQVSHVPCFMVLGEKGKIYDKMLGNVTLDYVLNEFVTKGDTRETSKKYMEKMRGSSNDL
ncbi:MAG: type-F conjugative transfer system pilin assembly protein TrbC [Rickettsiales bacterium]|nr:type-F conjugative transfer system pilin assembly protein TrbC [Rickettsiales bacterium]